MKNKYIILLLNILLVLSVGFIIGFSFSDHIFSESTSMIAFILFLITICFPSFLYLLSKEMMVGSKIVIILFIVLEVITNILFMLIPSWGTKTLALTQTICISLLLLSLIIIVAFFKENNKNQV